MKNLLLFCLLGGALQAAGQASPLPVDSASGRVTYRGVVPVPNETADVVFERARVFAKTSLMPPVINEKKKTVTGVWERPVGSGRLIRYELGVVVADGSYQYKLSDFESKAAPGPAPAPGTEAASPAPAASTPLEQVLQNPASYKAGKPTPAFVAYRTTVHKTVQLAIADLQRRLKPGPRGR
ncbi:hypothetical protein GCM10023185_32150 [Hymenobacter saemangeumensis]|uniref:DUF4468 domain-containing protein n=1 Tax=Hymenobacter saemangeumensis TaxID=1084522 RepID=A0ABP8IN90_9BACT